MKLKVKRTDNPTAAKSYVGVDRELTMDLSRRTISVHDGVTPGGAIEIGSTLYNSGLKPVLSNLYSQTDFTATYLATGNLIMGLVKPDAYEVEIAISTTADLDATAEIVKMGMKFVVSEGSEGAYTSIPLEVRPQTAYIRGVGVTASAYADDAVGVDTLYVFARYVDGVEVSDWSEPVIMSRAIIDTVTLGTSETKVATPEAGFHYFGLPGFRGIVKKASGENTLQLADSTSFGGILNPSDIVNFTVAVPESNSRFAFHGTYTDFSFISTADVTEGPVVITVSQGSNVGYKNLSDPALSGYDFSQPFAAKWMGGTHSGFIFEDGKLVLSQPFGTVSVVDLKVEMDAYFGLDFSSNYGAISGFNANLILAMSDQGIVAWALINDVGNIIDRGQFSSVLGASFPGATVTKVANVYQAGVGTLCSAVGHVYYSSGQTEYCIPFVMTDNGINHYAIARITLGENVSPIDVIDFIKMDRVSPSLSSAVRCFSQSKYDPVSKLFTSALGAFTAPSGISGVEYAAANVDSHGVIIAAPLSGVQDGDDLTGKSLLSVYDFNSGTAISGLDGDVVIGVGGTTSAPIAVVYDHASGEWKNKNILLS